LEALVAGDRGAARGREARAVPSERDRRQLVGEQGSHQERNRLLRRTMTRLGYQIPNFTFPGNAPAQVFEKVASQAKAADASGFDTLLLMDHFYQLPMLGPPDAFMMECYTT